ncbi:hypothetical protein ACFX12_024361 [Malus domestica]
MATPSHSLKPNHILQTPNSTWMKTWCPKLFEKRSNPWAKQHLKSRSGKPCQKSKKKKLCHLQAKTTMNLLNLQQPKGVERPQMDQTYPFSDTSRRLEERMVNPLLKLQQAKPMHSGTWIM